MRAIVFLNTNSKIHRATDIYYRVQNESVHIDLHRHDFTNKKGAAKFAKRKKGAAKFAQRLIIIMLRKGPLFVET